jgi:hypothetical protein
MIILLIFIDDYLMMNYLTDLVLYSNYRAHSSSTIPQFQCFNQQKLFMETMGLHMLYKGFC